MRIGRRFDIPLIAAMALREKQIQQNYRPIIGVHKWFARRPGTLFRGLLLAEFGRGRLEDLFFRANDFPGLRIADPFMGGGTPLIEANRVGCDVDGFDINPMSAWIVREEIEHIDLAVYERAARALIDALRAEIDRYYRTSCPRYGDPDVPVKSFLWVKVLDCEACGASIDLFPGYLLAENRRHPKNVLVCPACGDLNEVDDRNRPGSCASCASTLQRAGPAGRGHCKCPNCGHDNTYPGDAGRPLGHRLFAIEYHNPYRKARHKGRFFKKPDAEDLTRVEEAARRWEQLSPRFVPDESIPSGDETDRLHRWGYARYREMFNPRQLLGLELSCRLIADTEDPRIRHALATNLSDLLRLLRGRRRDPGRRPGVLGIVALPCGDGRLDSHSRHEFVDHRHRLRVSEFRHHTGELAVRHARAARRDRRRGPGTTREYRQDTDLRRYAMHRSRPPDADGGLGASGRLGRLSADGGEDRGCS